MDFNVHILWKSLQKLLNNFIAFLPKLAIAIIVLIAFYYFAKLIKSIIKSLIGKRKQNLSIVLGRLARWTIFVLGLFITLMILIPTFKMGDFVAALGLGTVAISFAFKDIFQNFLAGILILLSRPFNIGDQIIVEEGDFEGTVTHITTRATFICTYDNKRVVIPNSNIFTGSVIVTTAYESSRSHYDVSIRYDDDAEKVKEIILDAIQNVEGVLDMPNPDVKIIDLTNFAVTLRVRWWTNSRHNQIIAIREKVLMAIKNNMNTEGVDLPFPTQLVLFNKDMKKKRKLDENFR